MVQWRQYTFEKQEYDNRIERLRKKMQEQNFDLTIVTSPDNLTYLTGFQTSGYDQVQALFVPLDQDPYMVTRLLEESNVISRTYIEKTHPFIDTDCPFEKIKEAFQKFSPLCKNVAYEKESFFLNQERHKKLADALAPLSLKDSSGLVESLRAVKTKAELEVMQIAAKVTEAGVRAAIEEVAVGKSENDVAAAAHNAMYRAGGEYPSVPPYITSGPRTIIGHATWEGRKIEANEPVFIEVAGCYRRYHAAMMRTVFTGKQPPQEMLEAARIVNDDIDSIMQAMKPGITAGEVDRLARGKQDYKKIGATRFSRTGYSMGISYAPSWDEGQVLSLCDGNEVELKENMVFHLIPWMQLPKYQWVMGISETVRVTNKGAVSLFDFPRDFALL